MGKSAPSMPAPPDPNVTAAAQSQANIDAARATADRQARWMRIAAPSRRAASTLFMMGRHHRWICTAAFHHFQHCEATRHLYASTRPLCGAVRTDASKWGITRQTCSCQHAYMCRVWGQTRAIPPVTICTKRRAACGSI